MKKLMLLAAALLLTAGPAFANAEIGKPAPEIEGTDVLSGQPFKLSDHKGKTVVIEWTNHQCPFVVKHYGSGNMQKTQEAAKAQGVEWVSVVSSAPGLQGNVTPEEAKKIVEDVKASPTAKILDESGEIGKAYGATNTPQLFIVSAEGNVVYEGAIDSDSSPNPASIEGATNYVLAALKDIAEGKPVATPVTQPYGCGVKYAH